MTMETNEMLLQIFEVMLDQQASFCELARNDLLLIESSRQGVSEEARAVAAAAVRATLYSVDATADRIRSLSEQARN